MSTAEAAEIESSYTDFSQVPVDANYDHIENLLQVFQEKAGRGSCWTAGKRRGPSQSFIFPAKLHDILSDDTMSEVITWMPHGRSWKVVDKTTFSKLVMKQHFSQTKYPSFVRQVNGWGFTRINHGEDEGSYYNSLFLRTKKFLVKFMRRQASKKGTTAAAPSFWAYPALPPNKKPAVNHMKPSKSISFCARAPNGVTVFPQPISAKKSINELKNIPPSISTRPMPASGTAATDMMMSPDAPLLLISCAPGSPHQPPAATVATANSGEWSGSPPSAAAAIAWPGTCPPVAGVSIEWPSTSLPADPIMHHDQWNKISSQQRAHERRREKNGQHKFSDSQASGSLSPQASSFSSMALPAGYHLSAHGFPCIADTIFSFPGKHQSQIKQGVGELASNRMPFHFGSQYHPNPECCAQQDVLQKHGRLKSNTGWESDEFLGQSRELPFMHNSDPVTNKLYHGPTAECIKNEFLTGGPSVKSQNVPCGHSRRIQSKNKRTKKLVTRNKRQNHHSSPEVKRNHANMLRDAEPLLQNDESVEFFDGELLDRLFND